MNSKWSMMIFPRVFFNKYCVEKKTRGFFNEGGTREKMSRQKQQQQQQRSSNAKSIIE